MHRVFATYLRGEVAGGHVGGGGGTDTIEFLLEKEGGFPLLALLIQGEGGGGVGEPSLARDRDLTAVRTVAAHQLGVVAGRVAVGLEGASGSAPHSGVVWMPQGGGRGIAPGEEELALADDGDGDGGLGSFVALVGGPVPQAAQAKGGDRRNCECDEDENCELHGWIRGGSGERSIGMGWRWLSFQRNEFMEINWGCWLQTLSLRCNLATAISFDFV